MMVDLEALRAKASAAVWKRGESYAAEGRVTLVSAREGRAAARVEGTETYHCRLEGAGLEAMRCSCPAFADFPGPCKHLVATALTLARQGTGAPVAADRLRDWLMGLGKETLVARILDLAEADPDLEARLLLEAETATARPEELANILRKAITEATETHGFVDYRRMRDWASGVDAVIDSMEAAAVAGGAQANSVLGLVPELIARLEAAVEESEDDGLLSMLLDRAVALLAAAARTARPDPQAFGRMVAELDLGTDYAEIGPPEGALAEAMGEAGLAAYWSVIEAEWNELAPIRPAERKQPEHAPAAYDGQRATLTARMLFRARGCGDTEGELAVLEKTLAGSHDYLRLAQRLHALGRTEKAAAMIDEALWLFGEDESIPLVRDGARILAAAGESSRALDLLWRAFTRHPYIEGYRDLLAAAAQADQEAAWREKALAWLEDLRRGRLPEEDTPNLWGERAEVRAADVLVTIAIEEGALDRAWAIADASKLSREAWERLAKASEAIRPRDAIRVYKTLAERAVETTTKGGYIEAIGFIRRIRRLAQAAGGESEVRGWFTELRTRYRRKRSFIAMFDAELETGE